MGGALAALGLGAGLASSQSGRNQTEAAPSVSPVPTTIPDGEGEENNGMPPNWDSYGQAKPVYAPAAEVPPLTDEQVTSKDKKNEVKPHSAGTDGNKYGENGEDILPMMKPVNPSTIADKGTSAG